MNTRGEVAIESLEQLFASLAHDVSNRPASLASDEVANVVVLDPLDAFYEKARRTYVVVEIGDVELIRRRIVTRCAYEVNAAIRTSGKAELERELSAADSKKTRVLHDKGSARLVKFLSDDVIPEEFRREIIP